MYLHSNGQLIPKPPIVVETDSEYFDSPFVTAVWLVDPDNIEQSLEEAKSMGATNIEQMRKFFELDKQ
jgi:hypothetical protein